MSTIKEVSNLSGVSVGTVSRYLNGATNIKESNIKRIELAVKKLDYKPNIFAQSLKQKRSYSIGILVNNINNIFSSSFSGKLEYLLEQDNYTTLIIDYHNNQSDLKNKIGFLLSKSMDALVLVASEQRASDMDYLNKLKIPIIVLDNPVDLPHVTSVIVNNEESVHKVVNTMIDNIGKDVGLIALPTGTYIGNSRLNGWKDAFLDHGLEPNVDNIRFGTYETHTGYSATKSLLKAGKVDSIFACNYYLALGSLQAIFEENLIIGKDIGFASFDAFDLMNVFNPPLTVIEQPIDELAKTVYEILLSSRNSDSIKSSHKRLITLDSHIKYTNSIRKQ